MSPKNHSNVPTGRLSRFTKLGSLVTGVAEQLSQLRGAAMKTSLSIPGALHSFPRSRVVMPTPTQEHGS